MFKLLVILFIFDVGQHFTGQHFKWVNILRGSQFLYVGCVGQIYFFCMDQFFNVGKNFLCELKLFAGVYFSAWVSFSRGGTKKSLFSLSQ